MNALIDSNLQQLLPFNYFTFTSNHFLCTWLILIITAIITFWKIRPKPHYNVNSVPTQTKPVMITNLNPPLVKPLILTEDIDGVRKGKFIVYYEEDEVQCKFSEKEEFLTMNWNYEEEEEWWKRVLKLRNGENENGWYTFQDLTEINGNVVKLWDGGLRL